MRDLVLTTHSLSLLSALQMERIVADGMDLRGVMYWTLIDNWEWASGFTKHFGLFRCARVSEHISRHDTDSHHL